MDDHDLGGGSDRGPGIWLKKSDGVAIQDSSHVKDQDPGGSSTRLDRKGLVHNDGVWLDRHRAASVWTRSSAAQHPRMAKTVSLEDHLAVVEQAVQALEGGELPLEESLKRYEQGLVALRQAKSLLDRYSARLEELRGDQSPVSP